MFPQVYENQKVVQGLVAYASRLKGELVRAERELVHKDVDAEAVTKRCDYYAALLAQVEAVGRSLSPDTDWDGIKSKVGLLDGYRTARGELRMAILRLLKERAEPISVNRLHERLIETMQLTFETKRERKEHRAIVVDALHDLRKGPPSLVETTHEGKFGVPRQPEQRWYLKQLRPRSAVSA